MGEPFYGVDMCLSKQIFVRRESGLRAEVIAEGTTPIFCRSIILSERI